MINARDLADELLTLQPVDPAHCNPRRKAHPVIGGRELECSECWRERVTERLEQWRRDIVSSRPGPLKPAQAPSVGLDAPHPGATAPGGAFPGDAGAPHHHLRALQTGAERPTHPRRGPHMNNNPRPIIEWLASVGLDAQRIPAREPRLVRRDGGAWFLRFYEFALDADGRRILDGDGFAHTPTREVEVATLPPEPWLSDWVAPLDDLDDDAEWEARTAGRSRAASPPATTAL